MFQSGPRCGCQIALQQITERFLDYLVGNRSTPGGMVRLRPYDAFASETLIGVGQHRDCGHAALVSVRRVLESYESDVIEGWWPVIRRGSPDVDEQEPSPLRPQQVALSERSD